MPIFGIGIHILIAIYFAIHALRSGRNMYWLFVLFAFPLLGSIVYFFVEYLPELRGSRAAHVAGKTVRKLVDPGRALRETQRAVELSPSADNRMRYAEALSAAGRPDEAITQYQDAAVGVLEFDPRLNLGLADTLLAQGRAVEARSIVERYLQHERGTPPSEMPVLYARILAACGDTAAAEAQFSRVMQDDPTPEARCSYGEFLAASGQKERAREVFTAFLTDAKHWPKHARNLNRALIARAEAGMR